MLAGPAKARADADDFCFDAERWLSGRARARRAASPTATLTSTPTL
jgi:hypothetical protein